MTHSILLERVENLRAYLESEHYRGYDPFDGLESPLFKHGPLNDLKPIRFVGQQIIKRLPVNVRPLLGILKGYNPVTLALVLQGYVNLTRVYPEKNESYIEKIGYCIGELRRLASRGFSGLCWGYDFDWEARYASIGRGQPTVVATGIVTNSLFTAYQSLGIEEALALCLDSVPFVLKDLNRTYEGDNFCFSYSPFDRQVVFNASMKAARLLSQVYSVTGDEELVSTARRAVGFVIRNQRRDGSWSYSKGDTRNWCDNFHTAYILDCLDEYSKLTGHRESSPNLEIGLKFYSNNFFLRNGVPKYYSNAIFPIDATSAGQSILTLCRFSDSGRATRVANWMIENMQHPSGYFYYQKHKHWTNRISYMRWSNAWMFAGLSTLLGIS